MYMKGPPRSSALPPLARHRAHRVFVPDHPGADGEESNRLDGGDGGGVVSRLGGRAEQRPRQHEERAAGGVNHLTAQCAFENVVGREDIEQFHPEVRGDGGTRRRAGVVSRGDIPRTASRVSTTGTARGGEGARVDAARRWREGEVVGNAVVVVGNAVAESRRRDATRDVEARAGRAERSNPTAPATTDRRGKSRTRGAPARGRTGMEAMTTTRSRESGARRAARWRGSDAAGMGARVDPTVGTTVAINRSGRPADGDARWDEEARAGRVEGSTRRTLATRCRPRRASETEDAPPMRDRDGGDCAWGAPNHPPYRAASDRQVSTRVRQRCRIATSQPRVDRMSLLTTFRARVADVALEGNSRE